MSNGFKAILRRILVFSPLAILFLLFYNHLVNIEERLILEQIGKEHQIHLDYIENSTQKEFTFYSQIIDFVKSSHSLDLFFSNENEYESMISLFFQSVLENQPKVQYIGLFGFDGDRTLITPQQGRTINAFDLNQYNITSQKLLYEVKNLEKTGMYIHPVSFIENPVTHVYEQMILLASPVMDETEVKGVIVFIVQAKDLLPPIEDFLKNHSQVFTFTVVDANGRILEILNKFKSIQNDIKMTNYSIMYPQVWNSINKNKKGNIIVDNVFYQYNAINPFERMYQNYEENSHYFTVISSFSMENVELIQSSFLLQNESLRYIIALVILFGSVIISLLVYFRKNDQELIVISKLISDQSHDGVLIRKPSRVVTYSNYAAELLTGYTEEELLMDKAEIELLDFPQNEREGKKNLSQKNKKQVISYDNFVWIHSKHSFTLCHMLMNSVFNNRKDLLYLVQLLSDPQNISRESFDMYVLENKNEITPVDRYPIKKITDLLPLHNLSAIMYLKLTNLDLLEAQYTHAQHHQSGALIRDVLISFLKTDELLFKYSPDTYLITISSDGNELHDKIERLADIFATPFGVENKKKILTYQCGISIYEKDKSIATLILESRMALAAQLHFNHQGVLIYDNSVNKSLLRYYSILNKIPSALKNNKIEVFIQPIVGLKDDTIIGGEALVRWHDNELGDIHPNEFIPIIERHHLEQSIDFYVIETAIQYIAELKPEDEDFFLSVNICPPMLFNEYLIPYLVGTLEKYHVDHGRVVLELTERMLLEDLPRANSILAELHNLGINIAIDDFGTGFSSLSYLNMLDIDIIKIDRAFIKNYPTKSEGKIMKAILTMAHELDIYTFVEGIETKEQLSLITNHGAAAYQGYLFSKAISFEDFKVLYIARLKKEI